MKIYNNELFPALDAISKAFDNKKGDENANHIASGLYDDAYITNERTSFASAMASYLLDRSPSRANALQVLYCTYGLFSTEWEYHTDWNYSNTVYFISHHKGDGTMIAIGIGKKFNKLETIPYHKRTDWRVDFFNAQH